MQILGKYLLKFKWPMMFSSSALILGGILALVWAIFTQKVQISSQPMESEELEVEHELLTEETMVENEEVIEEKKYITVDIGGAVVSPGVYLVEDKLRLADLVQIAGGLRTDLIDNHLMQKRVNFALLLKDSLKYYIPFAEEDLIQTAVGSGEVASELVSINDADLKELTSLSGIGSARAQTIVDNRPYVTLEELVSKGSISQTIFENIKDQICL
ncbi:helix-hairpin-helix domain-containing protein [bacterium]|nr:helix-hairpin-helix domain-containing protein [bacterium]MBQ6436441.1 helix-hairpin-helix domain-containing protein [bacterium]